MANYVNNKELLYEIKHYKKNKKISKNLHNMFYLMAKHISTKYSWFSMLQRVGNSDDSIEDMIHNAYIKCIKALDKYDVERPNPFAYFTSVIYNNFRDFIGAEAKQINIRNRVQQRHELQNHIKYGIRKKNYENYDDG